MSLLIYFSIVDILVVLMLLFIECLNGSEYSSSSYTEVRTEYPEREVQEECGESSFIQV